MAEEKKQVKVISDRIISDSGLRECYRNAKNRSGNNAQYYKDLDAIFNVALADRTLFPSINKAGDADEYMEKWVGKYCNAYKRLPSKRKAKPKGSCTDPALRIIVENTQGMEPEAAKEGERSHILFMSAENAQGNLLEEYIAGNVQPYDILWCAGNVLHAIDFCSINGKFLLQVKNKSNTENSSSSKIRDGTIIRKWFRLDSKTEKGVKEPRYRWDELNELIYENKGYGINLQPPHMSEADYERFLENVSSSNRDLICDK